MHRNEERSVSDVLRDILGNLQDIVGSEVRLAKAEVKTEFEPSFNSRETGDCWRGAVTLRRGGVTHVSRAGPLPGAAAVVGRVVRRSCDRVAGHDPDYYGTNSAATRDSHARKNHRNYQGGCRMAEKPDQIARHIESTRNELGSNLHELENKVRQEADWKTHFERNPMMWVSPSAVAYCWRP